MQVVPATTPIKNERNIVEGLRGQLEAAKRSDIYTDYGNALRLISQVVFTRSSGFVLEFLQNAEDADLALETPGVFRLSLNERRLKVCHNGRPFTDTNVRALCGIRSSKRPEQGTLGYLGIGFKSVFKVSDRPEVYSGGFRFKFEKPLADDSAESLWQVVPVWVDEPSEPVDPDLTTFIVPFRDPSSYVSLRTEFSRLGPQVYLFLRWITTIAVHDEPSGDLRTLRNLGTDDHGITTLTDDDREQRFRVFRTVVNVPPHVKADTLTRDYRAGVERREIAIGFALDGAENLAPSEAMASYGGVYSFLPLGESKSGAQFPIQADFLVQPGRDAINYEAPWNQWLADEVAKLCRTAINDFVANPTWRYQFLPIFTFAHSPGNEGYDKLFGPHVIEPVECFLNTEPCIPTADGGLAPLQSVVRLTEGDAAVEDLVGWGLLTPDAIPTAMGGPVGSALVHPAVLDGSKRIPEVNRWRMLENESFLQAKAAGPNAPSWFRALYQWLRKHPEYQPGRGRSRQLRTYHQAEVVLTADGQLLAGRSLSLVDDLPASNTLLLAAAKEWEEGRPLLHPDILAGATSEAERSEVRGFLIGLSGVQRIDAVDLCRQALLPKIATSAPKPAAADLLSYTRCCRDVIGEDPGKVPELWVVTKDGEIRAANEVFFSTEFRPQPDWEKHKQYVPGLSFLSPSYVEHASDEGAVVSWRRFLMAGGIKRDPDSGVEVFAVHYAEAQLRLKYAVVHRIEEHNFGYDLEVRTSAGEVMQVEVKGRQKEEDIELTPHETEAAHKHQETFYLCVVASIPEYPVMYMVQNPDRVGRKDKLTIPVDTWREARWS